MRRCARSPVPTGGSAPTGNLVVFIRNATGNRTNFDNVRLDAALTRLKVEHTFEQYDGDLHLALLAYNRGPGTVDRILDRGGDPDNGYAGKVLRG